MKPITLFSTAVLMAAVLIGLPSLAAAESVDARTQYLADQLDLDEAQIEAIDGLITEHRSSMREQMGAQDMRGPERREHMRAEREALHAGIREVLTAEQVEEFDSLVAERRGMMAERGAGQQGMRGKHRGPRGGMMRGDRRGMGMGPCGGLDFDPDFSKLDVSEGVRARLQAMHREHRAEMRSMHERHRNEMRELIGDEQLEKLHMPCAPERSMDGADDQADNNEQESN